MHETPAQVRWTWGEEDFDGAACAGAYSRERTGDLPAKLCVANFSRRPCELANTSKMMSKLRIRGRRQCCKLCFIERTSIMNPLPGQFLVRTSHDSAP